MQPPIDNSLQLSIIIPAFNEARRLPPTVVDMLDFLEGRGDRYEIIIVNDGSSDATSSVVKKLQRLSSKVLLIEQPRNFGKGRAVKTGVLQARGTTILMADADGATPFSEIMRLEQAIANGADVAIGSRALESPETQISTSIHRKVMGRIFNGIVNLLLVPDISDTQCGFKLFTYRAAQFLFQRLRSERFSFDVELLFLARNAGMQVSEIPINWHNVPDSKISLIRDSAEMFRDILRFYFWHRDVTPEKWEDFEPIHQEHGLR